MVKENTTEAEVVIIGSGATGSLLAAHLGEAGRKVVVLEAGPPRTLEKLYSSTIWSRALKWKGPPVRSVGTHPLAYPFEAGWGTGGSALHHYAVWLRFHPEDFKRRMHTGKGLDWPIDYDDLLPYYDRLQREVGVSGDAAQEVWRPPGEPYPMPPQPIFRQAEIIAGGFAALDKRVAPLPMAINSVAYQGRPACLQDGWCDAGCPTGALANPIVIFGARMARAGVEVRTHAAAARIETDTKGRRAQSVTYFDAAGAPHTVKAMVVIIAAFAVQTPRLLLNSANDRHPKGLGNNGDLMGRYFTSHAAVNIYGMFTEDTDNHMGRTGGQLLSQESYGTASGGYSWRIGHALKLGDVAGIANTRPELMGAALAGFMKTASRRMGNMNAIADHAASLDNRVTLTGERDGFGLPLAKVTHSLSADALTSISGAAEEGVRIFKAAGASEAWNAPLRTEHAMGGTIMGNDPRISVTNSYGAVHGIENLFIAGPGLFPSVAAVNPTFTAAALAVRTGDHIADKWSSFAALR
jgi:choline dehydrogenase-like flavoprotein